MVKETYNGGLPPDHPLNRGVLVMSLGQGQTESTPPESQEPSEEEVTEEDNGSDNLETK
jgi:hypothetical protein